MKNALLNALRSSEFWVAAVLAVKEALNAPLPVELQVGPVSGELAEAIVTIIGIVYFVVRVVSKLVKFVVPNPTSPNSGWLKNDS